MTCMSVSHPRWTLKGASGHAPRWVFVLLAGGKSVVALCDGRSTSEGLRGVERVRHVAISAKRGRGWGSIVGE